MKYYASLADPGAGPDPSSKKIYSYEDVWDADMVYGCNCDDGYFGPDCSLKDCPRGDDPFTGTSIDPANEQYNEKQQIVCVATGGTFTLTFKGATTANIPYDATVSKLKEYIQALPTLSNQYYDAVSVVFVGTETKACTYSGQTIQVGGWEDSYMKK